MNGKRVFTMSTKPDQNKSTVATKTVVTCITDGATDEVLWGLVESALRVRLQIPLRDNMRDGKQIPAEMTVSLKDINTRGSGIIPTVDNTMAQFMALSAEEREQFLNRATAP